jgi:hypothetical protein
VSMEYSSSFHHHLSERHWPSHLIFIVIF